VALLTTFLVMYFPRRLPILPPIVHSFGGFRKNPRVEDVGLIEDLHNNQGCTVFSFS
jgi:hypothetical protein